MGVTRDLARFVAAARYEDLSPEAVQATKGALLNILGCCVAGTRTKIGRLHGEIAKDMGGGRLQATILGDGARVSAPLAAYANGNNAFALDYEDTVQYITHPGFITIACGLALAEPLGSRGRDLILAVALGYEVIVRIGTAMQPSPARGRQVFGEQYHPFGGMVSAGKLLGLDETQFDVAFGIAGTHAPVPSAYKYFGIASETRPMREVKLGWGFMCMGATMAALSAHRGFAGGHGILDGEHGFHVMAGSDRCDFERITRGLGEGWAITRIEHKIYPAIARNHPPYLAAKTLVEAHDIRPEQVARIVVRGMQMPLVADFAPHGAVDAQFSLPHAVVMAVTREPLGPDMFADDRLHDPVVRGLLARVELDHDHAADTLYFNEQRLRYSVRIDLVDGRSVSHGVEFPRDQPRLDRPALERKFRTLCAGVLTTSQMDRAIAAIDTLDHADRADDLVAALCPAPG